MQSNISPLHPFSSSSTLPPQSSSISASSLPSSTYISSTLISSLTFQQARNLIKDALDKSEKLCKLYIENEDNKEDIKDLDEDNRNQGKKKQNIILLNIKKLYNIILNNKLLKYIIFFTIISIFFYIISFILNYSLYSSTKKEENNNFYIVKLYYYYIFIIIFLLIIIFLFLFFLLLYNISYKYELYDELSEIIYKFKLFCYIENDINLNEFISSVNNILHTKNSIIDPSLSLNSQSLSNSQDQSLRSNSQTVSINQAQLLSASQAKEPSTIFTFNSSQPQSQPSLSATSSPSSSSQLNDVIPTGHSHISIVNAYRNGNWIKLPVLLLAKGDLIALQAGDIAPCSITELTLTSNQTLAASGLSGNLSIPSEGNSGSSVPITPTVEINENNKKKTFIEGTSYETGERILIHSNLMKKNPTSQQSLSSSLSSTLSQNNSTSNLVSSSCAYDILSPIHNNQFEIESTSPLETSSSTSTLPISSPTYSPINQSLSTSLTPPLLPPSSNISSASSIPPLSTSSSSSSIKIHTNKHTVLTPDSVQILKLTGNIRMFRVKETPIENFIVNNFKLLNNNNTKKEKIFYLNKIKKFFYINLIYIYKIIFLILLLILIVKFSYIKKFYLLIYENLFSYFASLFLLFFPIILPLLYLFLDIYGSTKLISSLEFYLKYQEDLKNNINNKDDDNKISNSNPFSNKNLSGITKKKNYSSSSTSSSSSSVSSPLQDDKRRKKKEDKEKEEYESELDREEEDKEASGWNDENDEGINNNDKELDDRINEIESIIDEKYSSTCRFLLYFFHILRLRFLGRFWINLNPFSSSFLVRSSLIIDENDMENNEHNNKELEIIKMKSLSYIIDQDKSNFLPIPLSCLDLPHLLGGITMVCFIDDEAITESYSVTEEIFLLTDNLEENSTDINNTTSSSLVPSQPKLSLINSDGSLLKESKGLNENISKDGDFLKNDEEIRKRNKKTTKVTVLDLHSDTHSKGSRFENPDWWRYLSHLKPIGLNAMLTYKGTIDRFDYARERENKDSSMSSITSINPHLSTSRNTSNSYSSLVTSELLTSQKHLVHHIYKTLPLESLRELSEEIGFTDEDANEYQKVYELNVLAPSLENPHLLEDTHQWSLEECRRRGSLNPQLRGGLYKQKKCKI